MSGVEDAVVESPKKTGRVKYFVGVGVLALVAVIACRQGVRGGSCTGAGEEQCAASRD